MFSKGTQALLMALTLATALSFGAACGDGSELTDQNLVEADEFGLPDDDPGTEPAAINPNAPTAPSSLQTLVMSSYQIGLSWTDNSTNETGFKVYRRKGSGPWALIARLGSGATTHQATGLKPGKDYGFKIVAYNTFGKSTSNIATDTTMALIPAGCFSMGDTFGEGHADELPVHTVCITSDFSIDIHEATVAEYMACVDASGCSSPGSIASKTRTSYYGNPTYSNFPVIFVSWDQAAAYCAWTGKQLPTEAEWEYAARGGLSGKRYPWGDTISGTDAKYANSGDPWDNDTTPVAYYRPNGYGLYDMSGNVCEWVKDWYSNTYYSVSPTNDPQGPVSGTSHIFKSLSWNVDTGYMRVAERFPIASGQYNNTGIRCVRD